MDTHGRRGQYETMVKVPAQPISIFSKPLTERPELLASLSSKTARTPQSIFKATKPLPTVIQVAATGTTNAPERPKKIGRPTNEEVILRQKSKRLLENAEKLKTMETTGQTQLFRGQRVQMTGPGGIVYRGEVDDAPVSMPEMARIRWENGSIQWHATRNLTITSGALVFQPLDLSDLD